MSDLVERVVNEIAICRKSGGIKCEQVCDYCKDDAARAIKAVAEWGRDNFYDDKPLEEFLSELLAQLKEGSE
jgi:hypothetical protein